MAGKTCWSMILMLLVGAMLAGGVLNNALAQLERPGNWDFFSSPTRNPSEPRWGSYKDIRRQDREAAAAKHNFCPTSGCVVRLDKVAITPNRITRGQSATLSVTYTILTADDVGVPVTISREIFYQGKSLTKTSSRNMRTSNGTFDQDLTLTLPEKSAPGKYTIKTLISTGYGQDEKSLELIVD